MSSAPLMTYVGTAELVGTIRQPKLIVRFGYGMRHAQTGQSLVDWCKALPNRRWNPDVNAWEVTSFGPNPTATLAAAGFELHLPTEGELAGISSLEQLYTPVSMLASNNRTVLIRPRLCGFDGTQALIDNAGVWDAERELIRMGVVDVLKGAAPRPGILWDPKAIDRARQVHADSPLLAPELAPHVSALANALEPRDVAAHIRAIQEHLGGPVGSFGVDLFPYQVIGAYGVAGGHTLLADSPGVGKAHPLSEPILTPTGFRPMGELHPGDEVIGADGTPTEVVDVYPQGVLPIYRVSFDDGSYSRCTADHLWQTVTSTGEASAVLTTMQLGEQMKLATQHIPLTQPVHFAGAKVSEDEAYTQGQAHAHDLHTVTFPADPAARMALLRGVLDSISVFSWDSEWDYTTLEDIPLSVAAAAAFRDLVLSLGGLTRVRERGTTNPHFVRLRVDLPERYYPPDESRGHDAECDCEGRQWCWDESSSQPAIAHSRRVVSIEEDGREPAQCIRVAAADHLYVTRDYVVTHNTFQSIAATTALRADGLIVICPPVVTTNWGREVVKSGYALQEQIATYRTGRKEPVIDDAKVIVVSDSTLAARPHLIHHLAAWMNQRSSVTVIYDEAHRMKTMGSKRSDAVLDMMALAPHARPIAVTGTPVLAGPHELVPILEFTGHLGPVFGGAGPFLEEFCTRDRYGAFHPRKRALNALNAKLNAHVWVRRTKEQVLPFLPEKLVTSVELDVDLREYRRAHREIVEAICEALQAFKSEHGRWPNAAEVLEFSSDNLRFASALRRAAGLTKVPVAIEMVSEWVKGNPEEPVLLWAHHKEVIAALHEAAVKAGVATGVIAGGIGESARMRLVDDFQAGKIPVLICSITAAGVGITLTRSANAIFVESDWTPALMLQAMDRQHRIGQQRTVHAEVLLALGTLDEHLQGTLAEKGETLEVILGDASNSVAVGTDRELMNLKQVMAGLVAEACKKLKFTPAPALDA